MSYPKCKACGDSFDPKARKELDKTQQAVIPGELAYCRECADELFRNSVKSPSSATAHGCGGGRRVIRKAENLS